MHDYKLVLFVGMATEKLQITALKLGFRRVQENSETFFEVSDDI